MSGGGTLTAAGGVESGGSGGALSGQLVVESGGSVVASFVRQGSVELNNVEVSPALPVAAPVLAI